MGMSDDGEPHGTAGRPMLKVISHAPLGDVVVVVTRWFGGTKLGKGGLIRAYSEAAKEALAAAPERIVWCEASLTIECSYEDLGTVEAVLAREGGRIRSCERDFSGAPRFEITVLASDAERLRSLLVDATAGRAAVEGSSRPPTD